MLDKINLTFFEVHSPQVSHLELKLLHTKSKVEYNDYHNRFISENLENSNASNYATLTNTTTTTIIHNFGGDGGGGGVH